MGGHAGKSHLKQLGVWAIKKSFSKAMKTKHAKQFPQVMHAECHCKEKHVPGCVCLSQALGSRNYFSMILSSSETAEEFARRVRDLAKHACDVHEWDGGGVASMLCKCAFVASAETQSSWNVMGNSTTPDKNCLVPFTH